MQFSLQINNNLAPQADEVKLNYAGFGWFSKFIMEHPNKRYCISLDDKYSNSFFLEELDKIIPIINDYTVECSSIDTLKYIISNNRKAFLRHPVSDWELFNQLKELKVSDIYIDGPICFQTDEIKKAKKDILIRSSPTISPNASLTTRKPNSFYIRPEDLALYNEIIDIVDFQSRNNLPAEEAMFTIYKRGTFNYDLSELIKKIQPEIKNILLPQDFGKHRLNCGQRCNLPNKRCHYCDTIFNITNGIQNFIVT